MRGAHWPSPCLPVGVLATGRRLGLGLSLFPSCCPGLPESVRVGARSGHSAFQLLFCEWRLLSHS